MRRSCSIIAIASLCFWCSCYSYRTVRTYRHFPVPAEYADAAAADPLITMRARTGGGMGKKMTARAVITRYYALMPGMSPLAEVNNRAVRLALRGRWSEAEILFLEVLREDDQEAGAYNNLGVLYEKTGDFGKSLEMFGKACALAPDNARFRKNLETRLEPPRDSEKTVKPPDGEKPGNNGTDETPNNIEDMENEEIMP